MGSSGLPGFWMSIIGDSSIQEQLLSTMRVKDVEERALTLLTRTLFLIIMEIKCERDEALRTSEGILEAVGGCDSCRMRIMSEAANKTTITSDLPFTEAQNAVGSCKERNKHTGELYEATPIASHKGNSCISPNEEEEEARTGTQVSEEVLVPSTLDIDSSFPDSQQRGVVTQRGFVAETMDMNDCNTHNTSDMFLDGEDGDTQHTLKPVYRASEHTQHTSEYHTPVKWPSPSHTQGRNTTQGRGREGRDVRISDTRRSSHKAQDDARTSYTQNNSCINISKHKTRPRYMKEEEEEEEEDYTEDVMVESNRNFRTPRKENILSPHKLRTPSHTPPGKKSPSTTPRSNNQSVARSPEGSPVFRRGGKCRRLPTQPSPSIEAKRDITQAFHALQRRGDVSGGKETQEKVKESPLRSREHERSDLSFPSPSEKRKWSPDKGRQDKKFPSLPSPVGKGKGSPMASRQQGRCRALPSPLPSPHNVSDELTSPSILQPLGVAPCVRMPPPCLTPAQQRHTDKGPAGDTGGINTGKGEAEGIRGGGGGKTEDMIETGGGGREKTEETRGKGGGGGETGERGRGGLALTRSTSTVNAFTSARKLSLRRHHTTDVKRTVAPAAGMSGSRHQVTVSPPDPKRKKTGYRQTTVYNYLNPQTVTTRQSGSEGRRVFVDDEEALRVAMEESLQLKALADMSRELDQREQEEGSETSNSASQPRKESPIKLPNLRSAHASPKLARRSPKIAHTSPRASQNSPKPSQLSSKFTHRSSDAKPSVKRRIIEEGDKEEEGLRQGVKGKMEEQEEDKGRAEGNANAEEGRISDKPGKRGLKRALREEGEEKEGVLPAAQEEGKACPGNESKENASPRKGAAKEQGKPAAARSNRQEVFENSFNMLPQSEGPSFAHMGEVVRKRAERMQLEGWSCKQCKEFYEKAGSSETEVKEMMNKCSRHRSKHKPLSNTPEGFWNPFFDD